MTVVVSSASGLNFLNANDLNNTVAPTQGKGINSLACSSDGGALFGLEDGKVKQLLGDGVVDLTKAVPAGQLPQINAVVARQKGDEILLAQGNKIYFYDVRAKRLGNSILEGHRTSAHIDRLAINITDSHVASLTPTSILVHSLSSPHTRISIKAPSDAPFTCLAFSRYRRTTLMTGHANGVVTVWDISRPNAPLRQKEAVTGEVVDISYSPYNKRLCAVAGRKGDAALVDLEEDTDKPFHKTIHGSVPLTCIAFLPGGVSLVVGTYDGQLLHYNLRSLSKPPVAVRVDEKRGQVYAIAVVAEQRTASDGKDVALKTTTTKATPLAERPPNLPTSPESRPGPQPSASTTSPPDKTSRRTSQSTVSVPQKPERRVSTASRSSLSPGHASGRSSLATRPTTSGMASRKSAASSAMPSSPHLPSVSSSPPMPTKRVSKSLTSNATVVKRTGLSAGRGKEDIAGTVEMQKDTGKRMLVNPPSVSPLSSPPRIASPTERTARLNAPKPSTSTAVIHSPVKRNLTGPTAVQLEQLLGGGQSSDLLRTAFAGAMSDWRAESTRATRNLHMEVIRSAQLQKNEFRRMMEDYMDEVTRLREENEMLRRENERLRRGY
ncbi:WD40 repeat-like protein [Calocera viscosa TUFC12733]|uniref:WD40 repeat-like protein n=1 Tax=Calocera viscosa (strain TUFC12733) TaxID=1330018 RepID=A0A167PK94_CALVF|nr:WD40 repeat-like protein [Calocera viscosa TUFC12733]